MPVVTVPVTIDETGPTGAAIFSAVVSGRRERFYWNGPGSTVRLFWAQLIIPLDSLGGWYAADIAEAKAQVREYVTDR